MKCKKYIWIIFISVLVFASMPAFLFADEPQKIVLESIDKGLAVLKEPSMQGNDKAEERRKRLWAEISPIFNFDEMSRRALGQHWNKRSPEEQKEFVELFTDVLKDTYIGKTDTYSGEKFVILKEKQDGKYAFVQSKLITNKGTEVAVDYRLLNNQGKWRIYDVVIEGVSIVNNYRSQFNNILIKSPYKDLVQMMKEKVSKIGANK